MLPSQHGSTQLRCHPILFALLAMLFAASAWAQQPGLQAVSPGERALRAERAEPQPAAPRRVALIIGNGGYTTVERLINPASDARLMANTLRVAGFELVGGGAQIDLSKPQFDLAVQAFGRAIAGADVAMFYYSGHGMQVDGTNWLVPVEANPTRPGDLDFQMVNSNLVLRQMEDAGTKLNIMVLDACRNNPFALRGTRSASRGLAEMRAPEGTLISYATQPGNVALDGTAGNSPYTTALAEAIHRPGLDVFQVFNQVGLSVKQVTGGQQQPWLASSPIAGTFSFFAGTAQAPAPPSAIDADSVFWQSVQGTRSPDEYEEYLRRFPNGTFAGLARRRLEALRAPAVAAMPAPAPPTPALPAPAPPAPVTPEPPAAQGPERSVVSQGRWTTRAVSDCERFFYTWRTAADLHEFTDQNGQVDTERVVNRWAGGMVTETVASRRRTGSGVAAGTRWSYTLLPTGQVEVVNTSTRSRFMLTRCPG